jgi:hypothetical protein
MTELDPSTLQCWYAKARNFVITELTKNARLNEADPKADSLTTDTNNVALAVRGRPDWARQEAVFFSGKGQP